MTPELNPLERTLHSLIMVPVYAVALLFAAARGDLGEVWKGWRPTRKGEG